MANLLKTIIENDKGELRRLEKMADKVLVLKNGKVREYGKTDQVLTAPTDPYTKELMRSVLRLKRAGTGNGGR